MKFTPEIVQQCRQQFPALNQQANGRPIVYFDAPAGTQVPICVADAMSECLLSCNANVGGVFDTSQRVDQMLREAHQAAADFVGASDPGEIAFGQNMTSLTFALSRSLAKMWRAGDEMVVTRLDHDANITPWVMAAEDKGVVVRFVNFNHDDYTLQLDELSEALNERTRLVAVGAASNATGGINPVKHIVRLAKSVGALCFVDAVHLGPHSLINVADWGCDFLACSAYKFFGPHLGMMWGHRELLESLVAYKVRPADDFLPGKWMSGTQSFESIAGTRRCIDYLADLGRTVAKDAELNRRSALHSAFAAISEYERELSRLMLRALKSVEDLKIYGITDEDRLHARVPTFSVTHPAVATKQLARDLADEGISVWDGNYYALQFTEQLGLEPEGMVRIGLVHYNTAEEIDQMIQVITRSVSSTVA